ncbi:MAG: hypothetical protein Q9169_006474 [Polycauliona sp. 2 TL-2023]
MTPRSRWRDWTSKSAKEDIQPLNSPLLNLPAELRIKIWTYVLGDRVIIINSAKTFGAPHSQDVLSSRLRTASYRLRRACTRALRITEEPSTVNPLERYHTLNQQTGEHNKALCYARSDTARITCAAIHLDILCANRQIHAETFHILWTTNTFSFHHPLVFRIFTSCLAVAQRNALHHIHIAARVNPRYHSTLARWAKALGGGSSKDHIAKTLLLPALETCGIHLTITANAYKCPWINLDAFHTSAAYHAFSSCLRPVVPSPSLRVTLDRDESTQFLFPRSLFSVADSPYYGTIKVAMAPPGQLATNDDVYWAIELFYEAYILWHPDVERVKRDFAERKLARPRARFVVEEEEEGGEGEKGQKMG